jgi:hypothetical protein
MYPSWHENNWLAGFERPLIVYGKKTFDIVLLKMLAIFLISNGNQANVSFLFWQTEHFMMEIYWFMVKIFWWKAFDKALTLLVRIRVSKGKLDVRFFIKFERKGKLRLLKAVVLNKKIWTYFFTYRFSFLNGWLAVLYTG